MFQDKRWKILIERSNIKERNIDGGVMVPWPFLCCGEVCLSYPQVQEAFQFISLVKESISLFKALVSTLNSMNSDFKSYKLYLVLDYKKKFL